MNKIRRKEIDKIVRQLKLIQMVEDTDTIKKIIDECVDKTNDVLSDEEDCRDNIPENLQNGYNFQLIEEACDYLESAVEMLENLEITKQKLNCIIPCVVDCLNKAAR